MLIQIKQMIAFSRYRRHNQMSGLYDSVRISVFDTFCYSSFDDNNAIKTAKVWKNCKDKSKKQNKTPNTQTQTNKQQTNTEIAYDSVLIRGSLHFHRSK